MTDEMKIKELVKEELEDANRKYPMFHSDTEASSVIREEIEEMEDDLKIVKKTFKKLWGNVKTNDDIYNELEAIKGYALHAVQEGIQVVAMCDKAIDSRR